MKSLIFVGLALIGAPSFACQEFELRDLTCFNNLDETVRKASRISLKKNPLAKTYQYEIDQEGENVFSQKVPGSFKIAGETHRLECEGDHLVMIYNVGSESEAKFYSQVAGHIIITEGLKKDFTTNQRGEILRIDSRPYKEICTTNN